MAVTKRKISQKTKKYDDYSNLHLTLRFISIEN